MFRTRKGTDKRRNIWYKDIDLVDSMSIGIIILNLEIILLDNIKFEALDFSEPLERDPQLDRAVDDVQLASDSLQSNLYV